ncbi:Protein fam86a [Actinomortierella wolfii]|nr:Protein fam86a [Actinomortierella wolfii]
MVLNIGEQTPAQTTVDNAQVLELSMFIKRQVLSMRPIRKFQWSLSHLTLSATDPLLQQSILDHVINDAKLNEHPPSPLYMHSFLKQYISMIEKEARYEVADEIFERFTELMMTVPKRPEAGGPPLPPCFKSYALDMNCQNIVTVMEEQSTIGSGTTGMRTWEASYWLAEYLITHPDLLAGKNVIDLGCGVGFLGLACSMFGSKKVILTDGNTEVLQMAQKNITYNNTLCPVTTCLLDWENFTKEQVASLEAEVIIMSDLTYDPTNIKPLVSILKAIFNKGVVGYMSSAIRNPKTFEDFFHAIRSECSNIDIKEINLDHSDPLFFFDEETVQTVRVFEFTGH